MAFGLNFLQSPQGFGSRVTPLHSRTNLPAKAVNSKDCRVSKSALTTPTVKLLEGNVTGYEQVADRDVAYDALIAGGLTEIVPGLALGIDSLSSIETGSGSVRLAVAGQQPTRSSATPTSKSPKLATVATPGTSLLERSLR